MIFLFKFLIFLWKLGKSLWDPELQDTVSLIHFVRKSLPIKSWVFSNFEFAAYFPQALSMVLLIFLWHYWCLQVKMYFWTAKILIQLHLSLQFPAKNKVREKSVKKKKKSVLIIPVWLLKWEKKMSWNIEIWQNLELWLEFDCRMLHILKFDFRICSSKVLILLGCTATASGLWDTW